MAMISVEQRQYLTYCLSVPETQSSLEVVPERGGIVTRWRIRGEEIFYLDGDRFQHPDLSVRGGIPILFPLCGNLPDNAYTVEGQSYRIKQHGFARELPWQVTAQQSDPHPALTVELSSNDQTREVYPFDFHLVFTYHLEGNRLRIQQRYSNASSLPMPFSAGFHPYFHILDKSQLDWEIPATEFQDPRQNTRHPFSGQFDFSQEEIDVTFRLLSRQTASVVDRSKGLRLTLDSSPAFSTLVFWTVKDKDFYCLEPWTAPRNALNSGDALLTLAPGTSLDLETTFQVEWLPG